MTPHPHVGKRAEPLPNGSKHRLRNFSTVLLAVLLAVMPVVFASAQDAEADGSPASEPSTESQTASEPAVQYPLSVAAAPGDSAYVVDLELPGVWKWSQGEQKLSLYYRGPQRFRQPMNRPRCIVAFDEETVLVGDSASRDIYRITAGDAEPQPLSGGQIGIPMALAVDPAGEMLYVADAERRIVVRLPLSGGDPEQVAGVNARGLGFDANGDLWALTPDDPAVVKIAEDGSVTPVVKGRPFQYASDLEFLGDAAFVTDGYGKAIFRITADGEVSTWFEGEPLTHPVDLSATADALLVADPRSKQVYRFGIEDKQPQALLPAGD